MIRVAVVRSGRLPRGLCMTTVVVVGLGYVGLPLAMRAADAGYRVVGYDTDAVRVKLLEAGESYIEDVPAAELRQALDGGAFLPSAESGPAPGSTSP